MSKERVLQEIAWELSRIADHLETQVEIATESLTSQKVIIELQQKSAQANKDLAALLRTLR